MAITETHKSEHEIGDEKLVAMCKSGNTLAFGLLVERHQLFITRVVSRFLFRNEDMHEIVQDTFIRVWKHLDDYDGCCRFTTWIYTIAFNLGLDRMKAIKRRKEKFISAGFEQLAEKQGVFNDPADNSDNAAIGAAIQAYSSGLSEVQRLIFILRDLQDMTVEEVCRITGFSSDKVKSNLYHARKYMREKLLTGGYL